MIYFPWVKVRSRTFYYSNWSSVSGGPAIELSENNFESSFAGADNEQAVDNFNFGTEDLSINLFTDKEDSGWGIHAVTAWQGDSVEEWSKNTTKHKEVNYMEYTSCLLYTSDAADE